MIRSFKAVFFDAGGTLFHPFPSVGEIYSNVGSKYGCAVPAPTLQKLFLEAWKKRDGLKTCRGEVASALHSSEKIERDWWRALVREIFDQAGGVEDFENFFEELYDVFARPEVWRLYPGAREVLGELKRRGHRLGIVSNWDSRLFKLCEGLGLGSYLEFVLASAVFGASKPSSRIFREALRRTGVRPEEAVHVGDSCEDDVQGALGAGMQAILIEREEGRAVISTRHDFMAGRNLGISPPFGRRNDRVPIFRRIRRLEELLD